MVRFVQNNRFFQLGETAGNDMPDNVLIANGRNFKGA